MSRSVTITATNQDPAPAFADRLTALKRSHPGLTVDVQPAQFCGYSSQRLTGTFPNGTTTDQFTDRITHIWTNTGKYLVAIHVQAPDGTPVSTWPNPLPPKTSRSHTWWRCPMVETSCSGT